ncbi:MAG TPA: hypothetical protein VFY39_17480 [Gammaproteobacteria bacterium]|nr:hypothetical protein [Gammaproteobacteria bacterium]
MKRIIAAALTGTALVAVGAYACETPSMVPGMPDGKAATMNEMISAQKKVKEYEAAMNDYLACFDKDLKDAGDKAPAEFKGLMANRHNEAVSEMEAVVGAFNEQVRAYKAAHPAPAAPTGKSATK